MATSIRSMKNPNDSTRNQTCDPRDHSTVQPNAGIKVKIFSTSYLPLERKTVSKKSNKLKYSHILYLPDILSGNQACATHIPEILDLILFAGTRKE